MKVIERLSPEFRHSIDTLLYNKEEITTTCPDIYDCMTRYGHDVTMLDATQAGTVSYSIDKNKVSDDDKAYVIKSDDFSSNIVEIISAIRYGYVVIAPESRFRVVNENVHYYKNNNYLEFIKNSNYCFTGSRNIYIEENFRIPSLYSVYQTAKAMSLCGFELYYSHYIVALAYRALINDGCRFSSFIVPNLVDEGLFDRIEYLSKFRSLEKINGGLRYVWVY